MKKIIYIILSLTLLISCNTEKQEIDKKETGKYYVIGKNNDSQIIESQQQPLLVKLNKKLSEEENLEVIKSGKVSKEHIQWSIPKRKAYKLIYTYKDYSAEYTNGNILLHSYKKYTETKISYTLIFVAILFFIVFWFLSDIAHSNGEDSSSLFFVIGLFIFLLGGILGTYLENIDFTAIAVFLGWSSMICSIPVFISSKMGDENNGIIPLISIALVVGLACWLGENSSFLLLNILLPAGLGYAGSLFFKTE